MFSFLKSKLIKIYRNIKTLVKYHHLIDKYPEFEDRQHVDDLINEINEKLRMYDRELFVFSGYQNGKYCHTIIIGEHHSMMFLQKLAVDISFQESVKLLEIINKLVQALP